jgi:hypothetical protein
MVWSCNDERKDVTDGVRLILDVEVAGVVCEGSTFGMEAGIGEEDVPRSGLQCSDVLDRPKVVIESQRVFVIGSETRTPDFVVKSRLDPFIFM